MIHLSPWWKTTLVTGPPLTPESLQRGMEALADHEGGPDWWLSRYPPPSPDAVLVGVIPIGGGMWVVQYAEPIPREEHDTPIPDHVR